MAIIPLAYDYQGTPNVEGHFCANNTVIDKVTIRFVVDTAAQCSFIIPHHERQMRCAVPEIWNNIHFCPDALPIISIMGEAPIKYTTAGVSVGLFDLNNKNEAAKIPLPRMNFADESRPIVGRLGRLFVKRKKVWDLAGERPETTGWRKHSLLGRDVLAKYALISIQENSRGFLTNEMNSLKLQGRARDEIFKKVNDYFDAVEKAANRYKPNNNNHT